MKLPCRVAASYTRRELNGGSLKPIRSSGVREVTAARGKHQETPWPASFLSSRHAARCHPLRGEPFSSPPKIFSFAGNELTYQVWWTRDRCESWLFRK
jgi:hypothetical protein